MLIDDPISWFIVSQNKYANTQCNIHIPPIIIPFVSKKAFFWIFHSNYFHHETTANSVDRYVSLFAFYAPSIRTIAQIHVPYTTHVAAMMK